VTIVAHVPNLFDRSRFGGRVVFVDSPQEALAHEPDLMIVDLDRSEDALAFVVPHAHIIGFGPHVDSDGHAAALAGGYDEVFARSVFFRRLDELLDSAAAPESES